MHALDIYVFNTLFSLTGHSPLLDWLIIALAEYVPWLVVAIVLYQVYRAWRNNLKEKVWGYTLALVSGAIARGITEIIRFYYHHPRPSSTLPITSLFPETSYSFPSGHAVFFFGIAMGVYFVDKRFGRLLFVAATVICIARIIAGVHWPSDILAGAILGSITALVMFKLSRQLSRTIAIS